MVVALVQRVAAHSDAILSGQVLIIHQTTVQPQHRIITINIIRHNIINSAMALQQQQRQQPELWEVYIIIVAAMAVFCHHTVVFKRAYHLLFKRPQWWWMKCIKAIKVAVRINWTQSIIPREASQGKKIMFFFVSLFIQFFFLSYRCDIGYSSQRQYSRTAQVPYANGLNSRSRSVPDFGAQPNGDVHWNYNRTIGSNSHHHQQQQRSQSRPPHVQVLEQITTSVWPKINCQNMLICIFVYALEGLVAFIS